MKRTEPLSLKQILDEAIKCQNLEDKILERKALSLWGEITGPEINRRTIERRVNNGTLAVRLSSAVMRSELSMHKSAIIAAINKAIGKDIIHKIIFL